jgi:shikimate dehydrogenase
MIRLGLIGDNIRASRAPKLHRLCGEMCGIEVSYDLLIPAEQGLAFDALFARCRSEGYRGLNITLPYKVRAAAKIAIPDAEVRAIGAVNTVVFEGAAATGHNTDYSGFIAAYRNAFGARPPGRAALAGAGGAGKAVAFALPELGAEAIHLFDPDSGRVEALARDLGARATAFASIEEAVRDCAGLINCSPIGMEGYPGTPIPRALLAGKTWAFDAVYTPMETVFLADAKAQGLATMGGYELHFYQGILAFEIFTGAAPPDPAALRARHLAP